MVYGASSVFGISELQQQIAETLPEVGGWRLEVPDI
jgi:hypothetical protein